MTNLLIVQFSSTLAIKHKSIPMFSVSRLYHKTTIAKLADDSNFYPFFKLRALSFSLSLLKFQMHFCLSILCVFVLVPCAFFFAFVVALLHGNSCVVVCLFFFYSKNFLKNFCVNISYLDNAFTDISTYKCISTMTMNNEHKREKKHTHCTIERL